MPCVVQLIGDMELVAMMVEVGSWRLMSCGELLGLGGVRVWWWGPVWARLILELGVVGWGSVDGCWWRVCPDMLAASCGAIRWLELSVAESLWVCSSEGMVGAKVDDDDGG